MLLRIPKLVWRIVVALISIVVFRFFLTFIFAQIIDRLLNKVKNKPKNPVPEITMAFHNQLFIVDLHSDPYLWNRNLLKKYHYGHIDVPRLKEGNVALQTIGVATKIPWGLNFDSNPDSNDMLTSLVALQGWPVRTWSSLHQRSLYHAERLHTLISCSSTNLMLIKKASDLDQLLTRRQADPSAIGFLLGLEGIHALEGSLRNLDELYELGFRLIGLTHFFDNDAGGSAHGVKKEGLTTFGKQLVQVAESKKMIIDRAPASENLIEDVFAIATQPLIVSHTGVRGTCENQRNLSDKHVKLIAESGGLIGIAMFDTAVCNTNIEAVVRAMKYVADLVGIDHVAIGSDFDGAITAPIDASGMPYLTKSLLDSGFTNEDVAKIMGSNALRFLRETLPG